MRAAILILLISVTACRDVPLLPTMTPYKMDIQQGNVVTQDMVQKLEPGMTRAQVRFVLGTPLVVDTFHDDRWDYVYLFKKGGGATEQRRLVVFFKNDRLSRVEGDPMPPGPTPRTETTVGKPPAGAVAGTPAAGSDKPAAAKPASDAKQGETEAAKGEHATEEKGFFGRMLERLGF
jgi:outer membrane protein assembly factor BamE